MAEIFCTDSSVRFSVNIKDIASADTDPTTLQLRVTSPAGTKAVFVYGEDAELVRDSVGNYHVDFIVSGEGGSWAWKWTSTGTGAGADMDEFKVRTR